MRTTIKMAIGVFLLTLSTQLQAANETEPNGSFTTANETFDDSTFIGTTVGVNDDDYLFTVLPDDGTVEVIVNYTNNSGDPGADLYAYAYNRGRAQIITRNYINIPVGATQQDTFYLYCQAKDTLFLRLFSGTSGFAYNLKYNLILPISNDVEPNGDFADAKEMFDGVTQTGRISYTNGIANDANDYFFTVLPDDGTVEFIYEYTNTSNNVGADLYLYTYNRSKAQLTSDSKVNVLTTGTFRDTLYVYCQAADTFYFRLFSTGCFNYTINYNLLPANTPDLEPNNDFATAKPIADGVPQSGRTAYNNGLTTDQNDYYYTVLPDDGTVRFVYEYTNTSNSSDADLYLYTYNRSRGQLTSDSKVNVLSTGTFSDTFYVYCQAADTFYFRLFSSGCFNYTVQYDLLPANTPDLEPNFDFATAKPVADGVPQSGRIGYRNGLTNDDNDYFYAVLPDDGTVEFIYEYTNTSNDGGSDLYFYSYNRSRSQQTSDAKVNVPATGTYRDTFYVYCESADTFYFRATSSGCFNYTLTYNLLPAGANDVEPNNDFANAKPLAAGTTKPGRIAHNNGLTNDADDYFSTVLPSDGTIEFVFEYSNTSNDAGSDIYFYGYNRSRSQLATVAEVNVPLTGTFRDTFYVYCQAADSFYFRIFASGCFDYNISYRMISPTMNDAEPNNTRPTAIPLNAGASTEGTLGFSNGLTTDGEDYYRIINPNSGNLSIDYTISTGAASATADFTAYVYRSSGAQVTTQSHPNVPGSIRDTLSIQCQPADTFYVRFFSNACFNYTINNVTITNEQPEAVAKFSQLTDKVGFVADTSNATSITWDFGDGTTSDLAYPKKTYPIGGYTVTLEATKAGCNLADRDTITVEVKGIEMYEPHKAGVGGDVIFHVYGGGLDTSTQVVLRKGSESYTLFDKSGTNTNDHLAGMFDLHLATAGLYDVEITIPGEPTTTFTNGMEVSGFNYPFCTAEIIGPSLARRNRSNRYVLKISNSGNVMARSAIIHIAYPSNANVNFGDQIIQRDLNGSTTISEDTSSYTLPNSNFIFWYDTASAFVPIDTLQGEPYNGYFGRFYLPFVPANGTIEIPFTASFGTNGNYDLVVYMNYPNRQGSLVTPQLDNFDNVYLANTIDALDLVADNTKNVPLKTVVKTSKVFQKHLNLTARIGFDYMFSKYYGYDISEQQMQSYAKAAGEANEFALKTAAEEGAGYLSGAGSRKAQELAKIDGDNLFKILAKNKELNFEAQQKVLENIRRINNGAKRVAGLDELLNSVRGLKTLDEKRQYIQDYIDACPELQEALVDLLDLNNEELNPKQKRTNKTQVINSTDPNAIYGNVGTGSFRSLRGSETLHYMVMFENVDTASAAAQVVVVYDTIDPNLFDLSTFEFGTAYIGDKGIRLGNDRKEFFWEIDLNPTMNLIARVYAKLDTSNGAIEWQFISLDPATGDLPANPLAGILPPNVNSPQGEGFVTYSVNMRSNVANNITLNNTASIIFDDNAAIRTNTWSNLVDKVAPTSTISATKQDTTITFNLSGTDNESGMDYFRVYFKTDTSDWAGMVTSYETTFTLVCDPNVTYYFYVEGVDSVGNQEQKPEVSEVTVVGIDETVLLAADVKLYPNPSQGEVYLQTDRTLADLEIEVFNLLGSKQFTTGKQTIIAGSLTKLDVSNLPPGIYLVNLSTGNTMVTQKLVLTE